MVDYQEVRIKIYPYNSDSSDLLAAMLAEIGYDSFIEDSDSLLAYIPAKDFNFEALNEILNTFPMDAEFKVSHQVIEGRDWNEEWEKNYFQPIVVDNQCVIHSTFHKDFPKCHYDITIDPKMAFGTGHHSTTSLILRYILSLPIEGKDIIDMGTGTGILAILCKMRGAAHVEGIEIDPSAFANAVDNVQLNGVEVELFNGDASLLKPASADILIANINRNIVTADMPNYVKALRPAGQLILSGFYESDIPVVMKTAETLGFEIVETKTDKDWAAIRLARKN